MPGPGPHGLRLVPRTGPLCNRRLTCSYLTLCFLWVLADLPRVLSMPVRIYLPKGMAGRILCPVEANPPVTLIVWTKNERVIDFSRTTRLKVTKDGTLLLRSVIATDEGRYTCTPYSPLGAGRSSTVVQIIVRGKSHPYLQTDLYLYPLLTGLLVLVPITYRPTCTCTHYLQAYLYIDCVACAGLWLGCRVRDWVRRKIPFYMWLILLNKSYGCRIHDVKSSSGM